MAKHSWKRRLVIATATTALSAGASLLPTAAFAGAAPQSTTETSATARLVGDRRPAHCDGYNIRYDPACDRTTKDTAEGDGLSE
jgi:hypothetical protein